MNKKTMFLAVLILLGGSLILFLAVSRIKESKINYEIEKANYCDVDSDCVDAGGKCPFGCYVYVNKNEVERISELIGSYDSNCVYGCVLCLNVTCENNKCKEIC